MIRQLPLPMMKINTVNAYNLDVALAIAQNRKGQPLIVRNAKFEINELYIVEKSALTPEKVVFVFMHSKFIGQTVFLIYKNKYKIKDKRS